MVLSFMNMCDRWKFTKNEIVQKWYKSINTFSPDYKKMLKNAGDDTSTYLQQKDQQEDQKQDQKKDQQQDQQQEKKEEMSKKDAEKMLEALQQKEKELQEKLQKKKVKGQKIKILKDW